jgi:hypothetical protein
MEGGGMTHWSPLLPDALVALLLVILGLFAEWSWQSILGLTLIYAGLAGRYCAQRVDVDKEEER